MLLGNYYFRENIVSEHFKFHFDCFTQFNNLNPYYAYSRIVVKRA